MLIYKPKILSLPQEIVHHPDLLHWSLIPFRQYEWIDGVEEPMRLWVHRSVEVDYNLKPKRLTKQEKEEYLAKLKVPYILDVFLNSHHSKKNKCFLVAMAINQPLLDTFLSSPKLYCSGQETSYKQVFIACTKFFIAEIDRVDDENLPLKVDFRWTPRKSEPFSLSTEADFNIWEKEEPKLTLCTMQKNNPKEWIRDWILYHQRLHSVERIVLYDNMSENSDQLVQYLKTLEIKAEIILVKWDMPYIVDVWWHSQIYHLNHAYYWLWNRISWIINIDIDEYLVNRTSNTLEQYLRRYTNRLCPSINVREYRILPVRSPSVDADSQRLVTDFELSDTEWNQKGHNPKNIIVGGLCLKKAVPIHHLVNRLGDHPLLRKVFNGENKKENPSTYKVPWKILKLLWNQKVHNPKNIIIGRFCLRKAVLINHLVNRLANQPLIRKVFNGKNKKENPSIYKIPWKILKLFWWGILILRNAKKTSYELTDKLLSHQDRNASRGIYFYHFKGLSVGWKGQNPDKRSLAHHQKGIKDDYLKKELKRAKVGKYYNEPHSDPD